MLTSRTGAAGVLCLLTGLLAPPGAFAATTLRGSAADEAPSYQMNVAHTGSTTLSTGFSTKLKQIWKTEIDGPLSFPIIAEGKVFVVGSGTMTALDIATGKTSWSKSVGGESNTGATYDNGTVFAVNMSNFMSAFAASNGKTRWVAQMPFEADSFSAPVAADGMVFSAGASTGGMVYGVRELDGTVLWQRDVTNGGGGVPTYDGNGGVYVGYPCNYYKFDGPTGRTDWSYSGAFEGGGGETVVYDKKLAYIQDDFGCGDAIAAAASGKFKGGFDQGAMVDGGNPTLFTNTQGKEMGLSIAEPQLGDSYALTCWVGKTGKAKWTYKGDSQPQAVIVVNGIIVLGSKSGIITFLDQATGKATGTLNVGFAVSSMSAGEGTLVVVDNDFGNVAAFVPQ